MELEGDQIVIKKVDLPKGISEDFFEILNETLEEYNKTIKGLVE
jgi:antitoxin MazE